MAIYSKFKVDRNSKLSADATINEFGKEFLRPASDAWLRAATSYAESIALLEDEPYDNARAWTMLDVEGLRHIYKRKWHNLFLSDQTLIDFINEIKIPEESENLALLVDDFGAKHPYGVVVHFVGGPQSWMFYTSKPVSETISKQLGEEYTNLMLCHKRFVSRDGSYVSFCFMDRKDGSFTGNIVKISEQLQFFIKLLIYIDAFPESVTDGVPKDCSDTHIRRDMASVISTAKQIKSMVTNGICPHLRRGHFRFLQSDKFTNKRFQTVYVKPAIIGGTAETVKHQSVVC